MADRPFLGLVVGFAEVDDFSFGIVTTFVILLVSEGFWLILAENCGFGRN